LDKLGCRIKYLITENQLFFQRPNGAALSANVRKCPYQQMSVYFPVQPPFYSESSSGADLWMRERIGIPENFST
jgi:hypothetical protein